MHGRVETNRRWPKDKAGQYRHQQDERPLQQATAETLAGGPADGVGTTRGGKQIPSSPSRRRRPGSHVRPLLHQDSNNNWPRVHQWDSAITGQEETRQRQKETQKHTAQGIRWSSPTQLLVSRLVTSLWESGRDPEFYTIYGRMYGDDQETEHMREELKVER
jgi:hypothetical protein